MTVAPHVTVLGAVLGLIFGGVMFTILWWMLHPPAQVSLSVAKAKIAVSAFKKIIVPTAGTTYAEKAIELACRLGEQQKAEIIVTHIIEVPFTLPLNAIMEKAEAMAADVLARGEDIVRHHELPARSEVVRARQVGEGIVRLAKEEGADLIVIGIRPGTGVPERMLGRTTETVLHRAPCEVIIDRRTE
jgi:nucleotide-binding universal stress UspA family protein